MDRNFFRGAWKIAVIMGIPIRIHFSWLIVFGLITWSLSTFYFPHVAPDLPVASYWMKGVLAALLLFASVAFHELSHSFVAQRYAISIESITLFVFGGVAQMKGEPPHPKAEFWIALAGPLSSIFLSGIFFMISGFVSGGAKALSTYLAQINLFISLFNLIPGFPMDGGRILRSAIWGKTRNFFYATQKASGIGRKIALFFIFIGIFSLFTRMPGGLWLMLIGWFLYSAAQTSYQQSSLQETLSGVKVQDVMVKDMIVMSPNVSVEEAVNGYFLRYGYGGFPVLDGEKLLGIVTLKETMAVPRENWPMTKVSDIVTPHDSRWAVSPEDSVTKSLETMVTEDRGRLAVMEKGKIIGLITRNGVARYIQIRKEIA
ncbi:MAG: M50 family metallopeptidase [Syntrophorhabdus sp.]